MVNNNSAQTVAQKSETLEQLMAQIQNIPVHLGGKGNYSYLTDVIAECGLAESEAYDLLQTHDLINCRGKWDDELIDFGYVIKHEYYGVHAEKQLERFYTKDITSPHGKYFFKEFFFNAKKV